MKAKEIDMKEANSEAIKAFYSQHHDKIRDKRSESTYPLRHYAHATQYEGILEFVLPGMRVLDAGCGDGVLSILMANKGATVVGCDFSLPNIEAAKEYAAEHHITNVEFLVGDAEHLPFPDSSFDLVVSSHVLEHLPDFDKGLQEVLRVTKKRAVIAIPTALNPCSFVQLGYGWFWLKGLRSFAAFFIGLVRTVVALLLGREGVNESYAGHDVPHVFRFPWIMKRKIQRFGFHLVSYQADCLCLPYFEFLLPVVKFLDRFKNRKILRNLGYGTAYIVEK